MIQPFCDEAGHPEQEPELGVLREPAPSASLIPWPRPRAAARCFLDISMRHPRVVRLMLHESIRGGSRLDNLLSRYLQVTSAMAPLFQLARDSGYLPGFGQPPPFLFMLTAGAAPFALPAMSAGVLRASLESDTEQAGRHIS